MLSILGSVLGSLASWLLGKIFGRSDTTKERLGAEEATNVSLRAGIETIRKADIAAKEVERKPPARDPNDLDG